MIKLNLRITWFDGSHHSSGGFEDSLIDGSLVWGELAIGWEGAGNVWSVTVVLSPHVKKTAGDKTTKLFKL